MKQFQKWDKVVKRSDATIQRQTLWEVHSEFFRSSYEPFVRRNGKHWALSAVLGISQFSQSEVAEAVYGNPIVEPISIKDLLSKSTHSGRWASGDALRVAQWQTTRVSLKGENTVNKLTLLNAWFLLALGIDTEIEIDTSTSTLDKLFELIRTKTSWVYICCAYNYLGALVRGGQIRIQNGQIEVYK